MSKIDNKILRIILIAIGCCATILGILGIFLPLLPTVPLLLLAAACFVRSSDKLYRALLNHPHLGPLVRDYLDGEGIPLRAKLIALAMIWISIPLSISFLSATWLKLLLLMIGLLISLYLLRLPLREE